MIATDAKRMSYMYVLREMTNNVDHNVHTHPSNGDRCGRRAWCLKLVPRPNAMVPLLIIVNRLENKTLARYVSPLTCQLESIVTR